MTLAAQCHVENLFLRQRFPNSVKGFPWKGRRYVQEFSHENVCKYSPQSRHLAASALAKNCFFQALIMGTCRDFIFYILSFLWEQSLLGNQIKYIDNRHYNFRNSIIFSYIILNWLLIIKMIKCYINISKIIIKCMENTYKFISKNICLWHSIK